MVVFNGFIAVLKSFRIYIQYYCHRTMAEIGYYVVPTMSDENLGQNYILVNDIYVRHTDLTKTRGRSKKYSSPQSEVIEYIRGKQFILNSLLVLNNFKCCFVCRYIVKRSSYSQGRQG